MIYYESMGANLSHVLTTYDKRSTDHYVTWHLHCTSTFFEIIDICMFRNLAKPLKSDLMQLF